MDALPKAALPRSASSPIDTQQWHTIIESSRRYPDSYLLKYFEFCGFRAPQPLHSVPCSPAPRPSPRLLEWRAFAATMGFVPSAREVWI